MKNDDKKKKTPFTPGDDDALKKEASKDEIKHGDYTRVTTLSFDEVDPSKG
jgi:hypothetical protein